MRSFTNLEELPDFKNSVITIGSFDGVHAGHHEILKKVNAIAKEILGESILITFDPHPRHFLYPDDNNLILLTTPAEKASLIAQHNIDNIVFTPFDQKFADQTPEEYIEHFLVEKFHPHTIVIGYDHKFGKMREGNIRLLKDLQSKYGYEVVEIPKQKVQDIGVSSTKIRKAINDGDIKSATELMGHPYSLTGIVVLGKKLGEKIGFPTANLKVDHPKKALPLDGVYAVIVHHGNQVFKAMLYIGNSLSNTERSIEVNIFDFKKNIYGDFLTVEFIERVRDDMRFDSIDELKIQLNLDKDHTISLLQEIH